tara:strand:+ start:5234 stop:6811 length:1578 start_codon:yes stop_codon:yes gene_type:complete
MLKNLTTRDYLYLRDSNKINFPKISKIKVDQLTYILNNSYNEYFKKNFSKEKIAILFKPIISVIVENYIIYETLDNSLLKLLNDKITVPLDLHSSFFLQRDKNFSILNSIETLIYKFNHNLQLNSKDFIIKKVTQEKNLKKLLKKNIFRFFNKVFAIKKNKIYFDILNINLFLKILKKNHSPQFLQLQNIKLKFEDINIENRNKLYLLGLKSDLDENLKNEWFILVYLLPISLFENFEFLNEKTKKNDLNIKRFVLSNIRKNEDECFFITNNIDKHKSKLEIFQYGVGLYFQQQHIFATEFEYEIASKYYSWTSLNDKKSIQIPLFRNFKKSNKPISQILLINSSWGYFYKFTNGPMFEGVKKNFDNQIKFLNLVKTKFNKLIIKDAKYTDENFDKIKIYKENDLLKYKSNKNLDILLKDSFPVCSYLGTAFIELMANDIPHILFFRPSEFNATPEAKYYLKKLKKFNFIYYNPKSAAKFLIDNHNKIDDLWNIKEFMILRKEFRQKFCNSPYNWQSKFVRGLNL